MSIKIISATPGPNTTERLLDLISAYPQGITLKALSHQLNRPVSMLNYCLKPLIAAKEIQVSLSENGMQPVYFPMLKSKSF